MPGYYPPKAPKRPDRDSVPLIECEHTWCGGQVRQGSLEDVEVGVLVGDTARKFCSPGCASRWLIRFELRRSDAPQPMPAARPTPTKPAARVTRQGTPASEATTGEIRAWARARGMRVADRARLSRAVIDAYAEAHQ